MVQVVKVRVDAARNRDRIIAAAREVIAAEGPSAAMERIAARAGVAVGTLYRHHPTKEALVAAVIRESIAELADAAERAAAGADPGRDLGDLLRLVAQRHGVDRALKEASAALGDPSYLTFDGQSLEHGSAERRAWDAIDALLQSAQRAGAVRPELTVGDLLTFLNAVPDADDARERYLAVVLAGIRPASEPGEARRRSRRAPGS